MACFASVKCFVLNDKYINHFVLYRQIEEQV